MCLDSGTPFADGRPYLLSGADDKTAKVWDYQTKACVQTLDGHKGSVTAVGFHTVLPIILTGAMLAIDTLSYTHRPLTLLKTFFSEHHPVDKYSFNAVHTVLDLGRANWSQHRTIFGMAATCELWDYTQGYLSSDRCDTQSKQLSACPLLNKKLYTLFWCCAYCA